MNTRSARKKDLYSESNFIHLEKSQIKDRSTSLNDIEDEEVTHDAQFERFSSPTFNIHIHVPHYDSKSSKLFLPRIQPIINLHFDELDRKLEYKRKVQNKKTFYRTIHNFLAKISPKFGGVKFHFKDNLEEKNIQEANVINSAPKSSRRHNNDLKQKQNINSKKFQNSVTKTSGKIVNNTNNNQNKIAKSRCNNNNDNSHVLTNYEMDKDIKLKNAVVVLTDICKTKNYKHVFESNDSCKIQSNENESSGSFADALLNDCSGKEKYEARPYSIKVENESSSESFTTECNKNDFYVSENCITDGDISYQTEKDINNKLHIEKICNRKEQSFTALVEGWNFSDILNRFQVKYSESLGNGVAPSDNVCENESSGEMNDSIKLNHELIKKVQGNYGLEENDFEEEPESKCKLQMEISESEMNGNEKICFEEILSDSTESFSFLQYQNETVNNFLMAESDVLAEDSMHECVSMTKNDCKPEFASDLDGTGSDEREIISGMEVSSESIADEEVVKQDLPSIRSNTIQENKIPEMNKYNVCDVTHPEFHIDLIEKEMQRRNLSFAAGNITQQDLKSTKSDVESSPSGSTSSPKKLRLSNEKSEMSKHRTPNPSQSENFIRLNSSGPTEFRVASLDKISPSTSEVKDFKKNMLFGKRVHRFSNSNQLQIYRLKKKAALKSVNG